MQAARAAFPKWQALTPHIRARYLYALARLVQKHSRLLAVLETMDNGKPIRESRDIDIPLVARHFYYHAGWAQLLDQEFPEYEPCGVVGQIIPWNFPLLMAAWKIAPALATGNTVVLKPAEFTPLTALAFAELCQEAGLPAGVVNIVTGDGSTGEALVKHPDVDKIAFTGSTEVGRAIRGATAATSKRLSLELGGKSPFIVFDDADLDSAVEGLVDGIWFNQGQVCCAGSRLLMQESIAETLIAKIRDRMSTLRVGLPLDKAIDIGPIVARVQLDRIQRMVGQGIAEGATCWQPQVALPARGFYYPPTLLSNVHPTSIVAQQEIFGPVLAAMTFRTPKEAVELANNTVYGLAACVWSENINVALHVAAQLKAGVVWVNCTNLFDASCGFGGYRESGYGREGGREGLLEYLQPSWFKNAPKLPAARHARSSEPAEQELDDRRSRHRSHRQALHRWQASASRLWLQHGSAFRRWTFAGRSLSRQPQRHSQRGRGGPQGGVLVESHRAQSRAGSLLLRRESLPTPRRNHPRLDRRRRRESKPRQNSISASSAFSLTPPGPTSSTEPSTILRSAISQSP